MGIRLKCSKVFCKYCNADLLFRTKVEMKNLLCFDCEKKILLARCNVPFDFDKFHAEHKHLL